MAEMALILIAAQGMLNIAGDSRVNIFVSTFLAGKGRRFIVVNAAKAHRAAVADVLIDAVNAENRLKLVIRDKGRVQQNTAVIKLFVLGKEEPQRVRAGEYDFHAAGREHVREQRRALDKIFHQRHFVKEHIAEALRFQQLEVVVHICQCIPCRDLNKRRFSQFCIAHLCKNLADHSGLSRPAQAVENEHLVLWFTVDKVLQLLEALALAIIAGGCRKRAQCFAYADVRGKSGSVYGFWFW